MRVLLFLGFSSRTACASPTSDLYRLFICTVTYTHKLAPFHVQARAVVEGQMLSMRLHTAAIGLEPKMIIATGGGSANKSITKIMADVFGAPVMVSERSMLAVF
jgi:sugar (pentulose or hexulose) kinase